MSLRTYYVAKNPKLRHARAARAAAHADGGSAAPRAVRDAVLVSAYLRTCEVFGGARLILPSERASGLHAKTLRNIVRKRVPPLQNSKKEHQTLAASPQTLRVGFPSFGKLELARAYLFSGLSHAGPWFFPTTIRTISRMNDMLSRWCSTLQVTHTAGTDMT